MEPVFGVWPWRTPRLCFGTAKATWTSSLPGTWRPNLCQVPSPLRQLRWNVGDAESYRWSSDHDQLRYTTSRLTSALWLPAREQWCRAPTLVTGCIRRQTQLGTECLILVGEWKLWYILVIHPVVCQTPPPCSISIIGPQSWISTKVRKHRTYF